MREEGVEERRKTERSKDVYETTSVTFSLELRNRKSIYSDTFSIQANRFRQNIMNILTLKIRDLQTRAVSGPDMN